MQSSDASKRYSRMSRTKSKFTLSEDALLKSLVMLYGEDNWEEVAAKIKGRNPRQCKDRWFLYLSPHINHSPWTDEEENLLIALVNELGPHWVKIAKHFQGRTDTQIKNKWNVIKRKMESDVPIPIPLDIISEHPEPIKQYMYVKENAEKAAAVIKKQRCDDEKPVELLQENSLKEACNNIFDIDDVTRFILFDVHQNSIFNDVDDLFFC